MKVIKNIQENKAGNLECEILIEGNWVGHIMSPSDEYELSEELGANDWSDIKPCDQTEKDAHEAEQIRTGLITQLTELDVSQRTLEDALLGDEFALAKLQEAAALKAEIRKGL